MSTQLNARERATTAPTAASAARASSSNTTLLASAMLALSPLFGNTFLGGAITVFPGPAATRAVLFWLGGSGALATLAAGVCEAAERGDRDPRSARAGIDGPRTIEQAARLETERTGRRFLYASEVGALSWVAGLDFDPGLRHYGLRLAGVPGLEVIAKEPALEVPGDAAWGAPPEGHGGPVMLYGFQEREVGEVVEELATAAGLTVLADDRLYKKVSLTGRRDSPPLDPSSALEGVLLARGFRAVAGPAGIWIAVPAQEPSSSWRKLLDFASAAEEFRPAPSRSADWRSGMQMSYRDAELWDLAEDLHGQLGIESAADDRFRGRFSLSPGGRYSGRDAVQIAQTILRFKGFEAVRGPAGVLVMVPAREEREVAAFLAGLDELPPLPLAAPVDVSSSEWIEIGKVIETFSRQSGLVFAVSNRTRGRLRFWSGRSFAGREASSLLRMLLHIKGFSLFLGDSGIAYVLPSRYSPLGARVAQGRMPDTPAPPFPIRLDQTSLVEFLEQVGSATGVRYRGNIPPGTVSLVGDLEIRRDDLPELAVGFLAMYGFEVHPRDDGVMLVRDVPRPARPRRRGPAIVTPAGSLEGTNGDR